MSEQNTGSVDNKKPSSKLGELVKEHGSVKNIPTEALAGLGFQVVTEVMRGRRVTKVIRVEQQVGQPRAEANTEPKYPATELSPKTKATLGALTAIKGEHGLYIKRDTTEPKGERKVTMTEKVLSGNSVARVTDISYPRRHYENAITRELQFSADGSTVFAASITVDKPKTGEWGEVVREPKVTEIAPTGLEGFAADMLETVQQEVALDAKLG